MGRGILGAAPSQARLSAPLVVCGRRFARNHPEDTVKRTRREILKAAGFGVAGAAAVSALGVVSGAEASVAGGRATVDARDGAFGPAPSGSASTEVTDKSGKRLAAGPAVAWSKAAKNAPAADVVVDPTKTSQTILGFGAAFTDAACYTLSRLSDADRAKTLAQMFGQGADQGCLSTGRIPLGASDYSTACYSYDDGMADPDMKRFSIDHDRDYIIPTLKAAAAANSDIFYYGSPWSPPGWMKYSNSMLGGNIRPDNIPAYALYMRKFVESYADAGVKVRALTTQNEIDADQGGRMPACPWPEETEEALIIALGRGLEASATASGTKIWTLDHNYNLWGRVVDQLSKPQLKKYLNTVAWHGYVGTPDQMLNVKKYFSDVEMHWTEGGDDYKDPAYLTCWSKWGATFAGILANGPQSITTWNLALDERGRPNIGPFDCGGLVQVHSQTREIVWSGLYWALSQHARAFKRGAVIVESRGAHDAPAVNGASIELQTSHEGGAAPTSSTVTATPGAAASAGLYHTASKTTDGGVMLVLTNPGAAREVTIACAGSVAKVPLTEDSITTLKWS
jgi:glucosylceramidase